MLNIKINSKFGKKYFQHLKTNYHFFTIEVFERCDVFHFEIIFETYFLHIKEKGFTKLLIRVQSRLDYSKTSEMFPSDNRITINMFMFSYLMSFNTKFYFKNALKSSGIISPGWRP